MGELQQEKPLYVLKKNKKRAIIPKVFLLVLLGAVFYLGVMLNVSLLSLDSDQELVVGLGSLGVLVIIIIMGIFLAFRNAKQEYVFFRDRIVLGKKVVLYSSIISTERKENFIDKMFKTYSLSLGEKKSLRHIPKEVDIKSYLEKLVAYSKRS